MKNILANNRYEICSGFKASEIIKEELKKRGCPLDDTQAMELRDFFGNSGIFGNLDMPFQMYTWKKEKPVSTFWWRLTIPLFFIFTVLYAITIHPIHWILTGKNSLDCNNLFAKVVSNWALHLFERK